MYKLLAEYDRMFAAIDAHEFPIQGDGTFAFKAKAKELSGVLRNLKADIGSVTFKLIYHDGSRQDATYIGQTGSNVVFLCQEDDPISMRA